VAVERPAPAVAAAETPRRIEETPAAAPADEEARRQKIQRIISEGENSAAEDVRRRWQASESSRLEMVRRWSGGPAPSRSALEQRAEEDELRARWYASLSSDSENIRNGLLGLDRNPSDIAACGTLRNWWNFSQQTPPRSFLSAPDVVADMDRARLIFDLGVLFHVCSDRDKLPIRMTVDASLRVLGRLEQECQQ
jgi:hypothetical protein